MANLLTFPEALNNAAWDSKTRITVSSDAITAPDGTTTADKVIATVDNNTHFIGQGEFNASSNAISSVFAKAGEYSEFQMIYDGFTTSVWFDLSAGLVGTIVETVGSVADAGIEEFPDGWFRCWMVGTRDSATNVFYALGSGSETNSFAGNGSDGVYFWGALVESGSTLNNYVSEAGITVTPGSAVKTGPGLSLGSIGRMGAK